MLSLNNDNKIANLAVLLGVVCLLVPIAWALKSSVLQSAVRGSLKVGGSDGSPEQRSRIVIPKLGLDAIIVDEVRETDLDKGPMRLAGTAEPGREGNCCIAGHKEKWFRGLSKLAPGDQVWLEARGNRFLYLVTGSRPVKPNDASVLESRPGTWVTLITCTGRPYFGSGRGRLIVTARAVKDIK